MLADLTPRLIPLQPLQGRGCQQILISPLSSWLNVRQSVMTNSPMQIRTVEGDMVKLAFAFAGFNFGLAFAFRDSFNLSQIFPCDNRLPFSSGGNKQIALFRPQADQILLLTINATTSTAVLTSGFMAALPIHGRLLEEEVCSKALCGSETFGDIEMSCIATKCIALKKLCIKSFQVSDRGLETIVDGFPNQVKVKKCKWVILEGADWLRLSRERHSPLISIS